MIPTQLRVPLLKLVMYLSNLWPSSVFVQRSGRKVKGSGKMDGSVETKYVVDAMGVCGLIRHGEAQWRGGGTYAGGNDPVAVGDRFVEDARAAGCDAEGEAETFLYDAGLWEF